MNVRKQSFLERLTGTRTLNDEAVGETSASPNVAWGDAVYARETAEPVDAAVPESYPSGDPDEAGLAIDMYETESELIIESMIAGVTPENLNISITRDMVTIKGTRNPPEDIPDDNHRVQELYWGAFSREIKLPCEIDTEQAEAVEKFGLLVIRLPKLDINRMQELKVKSI